MSCRKRPHGKSLEGGRLRELQKLSRLKFIKKKQKNFMFMSVFISNIDTANFTVLIYMNKTLRGRLPELKNKRKVQLGNPKSGRGCLIYTGVVAY